MSGILSQDEMLFLARSEEFQKIIAEDPHLDEIEAAMYNREEEVFSLGEMLHCPITVGKMMIQPLTAASWAYLWACSCAYTIDPRTAMEKDADMFLFVLSRGVKNLDCTMQDIETVSCGACAGTGLTYEQCHTEITSLIHAAFRPLGMFGGIVRKEEDDGKPEPEHYDGEWLSMTGAAGVRNTGMNFYDVIYNVPLSTLYFLMIDSARRTSQPGAYYRKKDGELAKEEMEYSEQLGRKFIDEKNAEKESLPCRQSGK